MSSYRFSTPLASAVLVLGASLVPVSAFADDPAGALTTADLAAALSAAQAPTAAAARGGWILQGTGSEAGSPAVTVKVMYAVDRALTSAGADETMVEVEHSGTYITVAGFEAIMPGRSVKRALKAIAKPHATWVFTREKSLDLSDPEEDSVIVHVAPDAMLRDLVDPAQTKLTGAPTKSVAEDGSTTYAFSATDLTGDGETGTGTVTIDASGVLTTVHSESASETATLTYAYGTQEVAVPARSETVTVNRLAQGFELAVLPRRVRSAARLVARVATRGARPHRVTVDAISSAAWKSTKGINHALGLKVLTSKTIARGARITGTNPFTHARTSYTVTIAGRKAVVHKG